MCDVDAPTDDLYGAVGNVEAYLEDPLDYFRTGFALPLDFHLAFNTFLQDVGTEIVGTVITTGLPDGAPGVPDISQVLNRDIDNDVRDTVAPEIGADELTRAAYIRGDSDNNGIVDALVDGNYILNEAFSSGPPLACADSGDCDGDGVKFPLLDATYLFNWAFSTGDPPPPPFPGCAEGIVELSCDSSSCP